MKTELESKFNLPELFEAEAEAMSALVRGRERLAPFFSASPGSDVQAYLEFLELTASYVKHTVPALLAAGRALQARHLRRYSTSLVAAGRTDIITSSCESQDLRWGKLLLLYASEETDRGDSGIKYGHERWAFDDIVTLGGSGFAKRPPHPAAVAYGKFFVEDAALHPYAILGAKGVLEHLSLKISDDLVRGVLASGILGAEHATSFFRHHGVLDVEHVRGGDANVMTVTGPDEIYEIMQGAYFASGTYRSLVGGVFPT